MKLDLYKTKGAMLRSALVLFCLLMSFRCVAQQVVSEGGRTYKLHTVQKGEGLFRLSIDNGVSQEEIVEANPSLKKSGLVVGDVIRIPVKAPKVKVAYTVAKGETSYSIATAHGMSVAEFLALNPTATAGVREGQSVFVYSSGGSSQNPVAPSANPQSGSSASSYVVRKGDTAYSIATSHGLSLAQFLAVNPQCMAGVREGDVVSIPVNQSGFVIHIIADGETLYSIGVKYGVKAAQIIAVNEALNPSVLVVGSALRIPVSNIPPEDDHFVYHRMLGGETLYSICVKYDVLQDKVKEINPGVDWNALRVGQVVAVPKKSDVASGPSAPRSHVVERKETLYSISHDYGITIDELLDANPGLAQQGLKKGNVIVIPSKGGAAVAGALPATQDTAYVGTAWIDASPSYNYFADGRPVVRVALMLPFGAYGEMKQFNASDKSKQYSFKSRRYVEFYEGVRLALDSLALAGANISLSVFDVANGSEADKALAGAKPDLIIGPARSDEMARVVKYARANRVPVVLPFGQADSTIIDNPYVFQASFIDTISTRMADARMMADVVKDRVIIISPRSKSKRDMVRLEAMRAACLKNGVDWVEHDYKPQNPEAFIALLRADKRNVVVIPTNNEARVNSVVVSIASVVDAKAEYNVTLCGSSDWLLFQSIEVEVFHKLNTVIYSTFGVDYSDSHVRYVIEQYRRRFFSEPVAFSPYFQKLKGQTGFSEYGLWGYDVALQFVGGRLSYGPDFVRKASLYKPKLLQTNFVLRSLSNWGGAVNVGLKTITFAADGSVVVKSL